MIIEINKDQALSLWKNNNVILREKRTKENPFDVRERENANNSQISQHNGYFFIHLTKNKKKDAIKLINKRMLIALFSSLFFCFSFMNFAIFTNTKSNYHLIICIILFCGSFFLYQKALNKKEVEQFINNLK